MRIPLQEVVFDPLPTADPRERVFRWNHRLFRAVPLRKAGFYRDLFARGLMPRLVERGLLIRTDLTDLELEGYGLVLEHQDASFRSLPMEWCAAMFKDAALKLIELQLDLAQAGLALRQAHPWQMVFDGIRCYFCDLGAIEPAAEGLSPAAWEDLLHHWILPLQVMAAGHSRVAHWLLHDYVRGVLQPEYEALTRKPCLGEVLTAWHQQAVSRCKSWVPTPVRALVRRARRARQGDRLSPASRTSVPFSLLERQREAIATLAIPEARTEWSEYSDALFPAFGDPGTWNTKHRSWDEIIRDVQPRTILDMGSNRGWFAQLAARRGASALAADLDEPALGKCYLDAKQSQLPLLPVLLDFRNPTPGFGVANEWFAPATERLQVELAAGLALVHHFVFKQGLTFEAIIRGLSAFTKRHLVVEFIGPEDRFVRDWWSANYDWYTFENFLRILRQEYQAIKEYPSNMDHRVLLLCTREA